MPSVIYPAVLVALLAMRIPALPALPVILQNQGSACKLVLSAILETPRQVNAKLAMLNATGAM